MLADQRYYAYGRRLDTSGDTSGERDYTGQKIDATGVLYYNARYYDPQLGQFISPDTIVPDAKSLLSYNRYLYAAGNPLISGDPSGHCRPHECPTIIIVNGIRQAEGVPASNSVALAQNLAEWRHSNTYVPESIYVNSAIRDVTDVMNQNRLNSSGGLVEETSGDMIDQLDRDVTSGEVVLDPIQGVILIGHSGGGPVAIGVGQYIESNYNVPVKAIVALGSPLFQTRVAAQTADTATMLSFDDDPFGMIGVTDQILDPQVMGEVTRGAPINIAIMTDSPPWHGFDGSHNLYGQRDSVIGALKRYVPELYYLRDPRLIDGVHHDE